MPAPRFLGPEAPPADTLIVDCARTDGAATWSHWPDAPELPTAWRADTSTGQVLRILAQDPQQCAAFSWVANDHLDVDGVLAVACACRGTDILPYAAVLEAAAECGDFTAWVDESAIRLCWHLHQIIGQEQAAAGTWQNRCLERITRTLPEIIDASGKADRQRDAAWQCVSAARARVQARSGVTVEHLGDVVSVIWQRGEYGHAWDAFLGVPSHDDMPTLALAGHWPDTCFRLAGEHSPAGTVYVLDAPGHSWAATVRRPRVRWPDLGRAAHRLQAVETAACRWVTRPQAAQISFVGQLATVDANGQPAASALPLATVAAACREALRAR